MAWNSRKQLRETGDTMTDSQMSMVHAPGFSILLEVVPENEQQSNPVVIGEVGRRILSELRQEGYAVEPVYSGQKGALELLFTVVTMLQSGAVEAWTHVDAIAALYAIFETTKPLLLRVFKSQEKHPVKISVVIDGEPVSVEAADFEDAEAALKLAKRFHSAHPAVKVTPQSQVKAKVRVSKK
jgi:hypothetical protein